MKSEHLALIPLPKGITLQMVTVVNTHVVVQVGCQFPGAACPECQHLSRRVHSHYTRTVADLPCAGRRVVLHLRVRKFVCRTPTCPQQIFTERLVTFVEAYARMTNRLRAAVQVLGMLTGGQSGARLASHLGMRVSAPTLLRRMRQVVLPPPRPVRVVGIDDWAWRKGQTYHAPHNLAKTVFEFSVCILRTPLRQRCGVAFKRLALQQDAGRESSESQEGASRQ